MYIYTKEDYRDILIDRLCDRYDIDDEIIERIKRLLINTLEDIKGFEKDEIEFENIRRKECINGKQRI